MYPIGPSQSQERSFNDTRGSNNLINQRFRKVSTGANNNMSVELVEDLRHYPENDARRTLIRNRSGEDLRHESKSGNGRGTSGRGSHQEDPSRSMRPQTSRQGFSRRRSPSVKDRIKVESRYREEDGATRRPYERDQWDHPRGRDQRSRGYQGRRRY